MRGLTLPGEGHTTQPHTHERRERTSPTHTHILFLSINFPANLNAVLPALSAPPRRADASEMISKPNFSSLSPPVYWSSCAPTVFAPDAHRNSAPLPGTFCQWASLPNLEKQETTLTFGEGEVRGGGGGPSKSEPPSIHPPCLPPWLSP